jgi:hypothetical protein
MRKEIENFSSSIACWTFAVTWEDRSDSLAAEREMTLILVDKQILYILKRDREEK